MQKTLYIPIDTTLNYEFECPLLVKKYDTLKFKFAIFSLGILQDLNGQTVDLILYKKDGTTIQKTITNTTLNIATITLDKNASACIGEVLGEIVITDAGGQATSNSFKFNVSNSLTEDIEIKSKDDITTIEDMRALIATYKNEISAIGESIQAVEALNNITTYIDFNLSELTSKNAIAVKNVTDLKKENDRADTNIPGLTNLNDTAEEKLQEFREFDTSNIVTTLRDHGSQLNDIAKPIYSVINILNNNNYYLKKSIEISENSIISNLNNVIINGNFNSITRLSKNGRLVLENCTNIIFKNIVFDLGYAKYAKNKYGLYSDGYIEDGNDCEFLQFINCDRLTFYNCEFLGGGGIFSRFRNCSNITLNKNYISGGSVYCEGGYYTGGGDDSNYINVINNFFQKVIGQDCFRTTVGTCNVNIHGNTFYDYGYPGKDGTLEATGYHDAIDCYTRGCKVIITNNIFDSPLNPCTSIQLKHIYRDAPYIAGSSDVNGKCELITIDNNHFDGGHIGVIVRRFDFRENKPSIIPDYEYIKDIKITNNTFKNFDAQPICFGGAKDCIVSNNTFTGNYQTEDDNIRGMILMSPCHNIKINNNIFKDYFYCIRLLIDDNTSSDEVSSFLNIKDNSFENMDVAIDFTRPCSDSCINGNYINNARVGISLDIDGKLKNLSINGNYIKNIKHRAITKNPKIVLENVNLKDNYFIDCVNEIIEIGYYEEYDSNYDNLRNLKKYYQKCIKFGENIPSEGNYSKGDVIINQNTTNGKYERYICTDGSNWQGINQIGFQKLTTSERPTNGIYRGWFYFDVSLNKMVFLFNDSVNNYIWKDFNGNVV